MSVFDDPLCYPAVSLHQPYAGAIRLTGLGYVAKRIETRKTRINYRGPLVICATAKSPEGWWFTRANITHALGRPAHWQSFNFELAGCAMAIATVVDCRPLLATDEPAAMFYEPGRWAWVLEDITPLRPFKTSGKQGFFKVPRVEVDAAARLALADLIVTGDRSTEKQSDALGAASWPLPDWSDGAPGDSMAADLEDEADRINEAIIAREAASS